ncbi:MAG TPA: protoporphyrinogen oxidase [Thermodesulfobacteriota bacterium]|nr:protoporphyrinogen oxidase [Thermodesulfobacteriota bacterium]
MPKRVIVIGGGITGLSAAHRLTELSRDKILNLEILLLEKSDGVGGVISTVERDGFTIEEGPDSFITSKPWGLNLSSRLGLDNELIETNRDKRRTYVLLHGRLVPLPDGFIMLAPARIMPFLRTPLFSWHGKLRMLMDLVIPKNPPGDESLASFVRRRLGREALDRAAQPMIGGVYTADPEKLSLRATMPQFLEMEERYGSVIKGMYQGLRKRKKGVMPDSGARYSLFVSFKKGMKTLVDAIVRKIPEGSIKTGVAVEGIKEAYDGWEVTTGDGILNAAGVIITTPAYITAGLLENAAGESAALLRKIEYTSTAVVILAYRKEDIETELGGFGFVVPRTERSSMIACSFSSEKFPGRAPQSCTVLRIFVGGALDPETYKMEDLRIIETVRKEIGSLLGIKSDPVFTIIKRYPGAMPQYHVGHRELVEGIQREIKKLDGLEIAGNAFGGVGIPDCINSGERAAERLLQSLYAVQF